MLGFTEPRLGALQDVRPGPNPPEEDRLPRLRQPLHQLAARVLQLLRLGHHQQADGLRLRLQIPSPPVAGQVVASLEEAGVVAGVLELPGQMVLHGPGGLFPPDGLIRAHLVAPGQLRD